MKELIGAFFLRHAFAALTGGFFFDGHHSILINTLHFYSWMIFILLPLSIYMVHIFGNLNDPQIGGVSVATTVVYVTIMTITFVILKVGNFWLHKIFDREKKIIEEQEQKIEQDKNDQSPEEELAQKKDGKNSIKDSKREEEEEKEKDEGRESEEENPTSPKSKNVTSTAAHPGEKDSQGKKSNE